MKTYKKKLFYSIMALVACIMFMAMPNKVSASSGGEIATSLILVQYDSNSERYYLGGSAWATSPLTNVHVYLFKDTTFQNDPCKEMTIPLLNGQRSIDFSRVSGLSEWLTYNPPGTYAIAISMEQSQGQGLNYFPCAYTINKNLNSYMVGLYRNILRRDPDRNGLNHNIACVRNGAVSIEDMVRAFYTGPEFQKNPIWDDWAFVYSLYRSILGREPDTKGLVDNVAYLRRTGDRMALINAFLGGNEFRNTTKKNYHLPR